LAIRLAAGEEGGGSAGSGVLAVPVPALINRGRRQLLEIYRLNFLKAFLLKHVPRFQIGIVFTPRGKFATGFIKGDSPLLANARPLLAVLAGTENPPGFCSFLEEKDQFSTLRLLLANYYIKMKIL
jgi:hypothetical protein